MASPSRTSAASRSSRTTLGEDIDRWEREARVDQRRERRTRDVQLNIRVTLEEKIKIQRGATAWHTQRVATWQGGSGHYPGHVVDVARFMRETLLRRVDELAAKPAKKKATPKKRPKATPKKRPMKKRRTR